MFSPIPRTLYHYCSCEAFYSILRSKAFRLYNVFETSDHLERRWIDDLIDDALRAVQVPDENFKTFKATIKSQYPLNRDIPAYFISFSNQGNLLNQWEVYANGGTGFAIGVNTDYFKIPLRIPLRNMNEDATIGLFPVDYKKTANETVQSIMAKAWNQFKADKFNKRSFAMMMGSILFVQVASRVKSPSFFEEKEWRILYTPFISSDGIVTGKLKDRKVDSRGKAYFEIPFDERRDSFPIREVIIGPQNDTTRKTIEDFLYSTNLNDCTVVRSIELLSANAD